MQENEDFQLTFDDFENSVEDSIEEANTEEVKTSEETTEEPKEEVKAESQTETEAESKSKEDELKAGENSGAESPSSEYTPDFSYKIKDQDFEFPEWIREVVKSKEQEEYLRDLHTKADALEGIKESRGKIEMEFNNYKQDIDNQFMPVIDKISQFDHANSIKDFKTAWQLSDVNPSDIVDYMLMDDNLSELVFKKTLEQIKLEEQAGPQAVAQQKMAYQEQQKSSVLERQNQQLTERLNNMERNSFSQALDFAIGQQNDAANAYDSRNGQGAFRKFVAEYGDMKWQKGEQLQPSEVVSQVVNMLGLTSNSQAPTQGNISNNHEQSQVAPQEQKQPQALPNLGTGSNVSMVQKTPSTWDEWEKSVNSI
jgi:hypothetical protein